MEKLHIAHSRLQLLKPQFQSREEEGSIGARNISSTQVWKSGFQSKLSIVWWINILTWLIRHIPTKHNLHNRDLVHDRFHINHNTPQIMLGKLRLARILTKIQGKILILEGTKKGILFVLLLFPWLTQSCCMIRKDMFSKCTLAPQRCCEVEKKTKRSTIESIVNKIVEYSIFKNKVSKKMKDIMVREWNFSIVHTLGVTCWSIYINVVWTARPFIFPKIQDLSKTINMIFTLEWFFSY